MCRPVKSWGLEAGDACTRQEGKASSEVISVLYLGHICSTTGVDFGFQSFLEDQCLLYTMLIWGSGDFPPEDFSETKLSTSSKIHFHKILKMVKIHHEGHFLPLLLSVEKGQIGQLPLLLSQA